MSEWTLDDWRENDRAFRTPRWKRALYRIGRPGLDLVARRKLSDAALARWRPDWVLGMRGIPFEYRHAWGLRDIRLRGATLLVQGTGTGWDVVMLAERRPSRIIATDLFPFEGSWDAIAKHCRDRLRVAVEFRQAPLEQHDFLADGSIDACISNGVFEHCRDLPAVLRETHRVLRPGGTIYAAFGPLWFSAGGDHFSGRGGLEFAYAHLALDRDEYVQYYRAHLEPQENFQTGGRYVELDLFSKLTADEYLAAFDEAGFDRRGLIVHLQSMAADFERNFPARWRALLQQLAGRANADDLRLAGLVVRLSKR